VQWVIGGRLKSSASETNGKQPIFFYFFFEWKMREIWENCGESGSEVGY
jgi:hypothetical protein